MRQPITEEEGVTMETLEGNMEIMEASTVVQGYSMEMGLTIIMEWDSMEVFKMAV
jgi:hypothetical protein